MDEEEQCKAKQKYLREAIIETGYNAETFIQYLESLKQGGDDIDNWTLDELRLEVQNFTRHCSVKEETNQNKEENSIHEQGDNLNQSQILKNNKEENHLGNELFDDIAEEKLPNEKILDDKHKNIVSGNNLNGIKGKFCLRKSITIKADNNEDFIKQCNNKQTRCTLSPKLPLVLIYPNIDKNT